MQCLRLYRNCYKIKKHPLSRMPTKILLQNIIYTENEVPQPQVLAALGLLKVNPRAFNPS